MSTIRERDAAWDGHNRLAPMADRHALLVAGDALAEAVGSQIGVPEDNHQQPCPCWAHEALAAWKAATG